MPVFDTAGVTDQDMAASQFNPSNGFAEATSSSFSTPDSYSNVATPPNLMASLGSFGKNIYNIGNDARSANEEYYTNFYKK
jgi:hypothetical protein